MIKGAKTPTSWLVVFLLFVSGASHLKCQQQDLPPEQEEHPHRSMVEGWYSYGYLKPAGDTINRWMVFASFQKTPLGRYLVQGCYDLEKGLIHYSGLTEKGRLSYPEAHRSMKYDNSYKDGDTLLFICENNRLAKTNTGYQLVLHNSDAAFDLALSPASAFVWSNGNGNIGISKPDHMRYYFMPRLEGKGSLRINGQNHHVAGDFWYEHIWGKAWPPMQVKWNWWSLRLDNGTTLTISYTRKQKTEEPVQTFVTVVDSLGKADNYTDASFVSTRVWTSAKTNRRYPLEWTVTIPGRACELHIKPLFEACELPVLLTDYMWEGPCVVEVKNKQNQQIIKGIGIQELVGYGQ
ncbi:MAG: hypothetical protein IPJ82_09520 [Lewinellaceae bacterium]|nr:hypothetical protein [Lewinellaceae bacterium]